MNKVFNAAGNVYSASDHVLVIAEIGTAHNGDLQKAKELIAASKESGADAVKFQIIYADEILHPNTGFVQLPTGRIPLYERFQSLECPPDFYAELSEYAGKLGILFSASTFGIRSARELNELNPAFIKIASPELNHYPLLKMAAAADLPIILSTGVSRLADIEKAVHCLEACGVPAERYALLHCVTAYPAPETDYNTAVLRSLAALFNCAMGISDHSLDPAAVPVAGILSGACIIEKHICLSHDDGGLDDSVALDPAQFLRMTTVICSLAGKTKAERFACAAKYGYSKEFLNSIIGTGEKKLAAAEKVNYERTNRSIHYRTGLSAGTRLSEHDIALLRTEKELSVGEAPEFFDRFVGAILQRDVVSGDGAVFEDLIAR